MLLDTRIPITYTLSKIWKETILVLLMSVLIVYIDKNFNTEDYALPLSISAIIGTAISLVLAFRTAQAYDRWWEARKIWGAIVNDSRTLSRQVLGFNSSADTQIGREWQTRIIKRQIGWCYSLGSALRTKKIFADLDKYISQEELDGTITKDNVPNSLLLNHQKDLKLGIESGFVSDLQQLNLDSTISRLTDHMGKCERIKNTVFPTIYSKYTKFLIYLFLVLFSAGLMDTLGYVQGPVVVLVALPFILLEKTAVIMQDPFQNRPSDIDMLNISRNIERALLQMMEETEVPNKISEKKFYIM